MTDTPTISDETARRIEDIAADEIIEYLEIDHGDLFARGWTDDDINLGNIEICVLVIGKFEPSDPRHEPELVAGAVESILQWMNDYGIQIDSDHSEPDCYTISIR